MTALTTPRVTKPTFTTLFHLDGLYEARVGAFNDLGAFHFDTRTPCPPENNFATKNKICHAKPFRTAHRCRRNADLRAEAIVKKSLQVFRSPYQDPAKEYNLRVTPQPPPPPKDISHWKERPSTPRSVLKFFGCLGGGKEKDFEMQDRSVSRSRMEAVQSVTPRPQSAKSPPSIRNSLRPPFHPYHRIDSDINTLHLAAAHSSVFITPAMKIIKPSVPAAAPVAAEEEEVPSSPIPRQPSWPRPRRPTVDVMREGKADDFVAKWVQLNMQLASKSKNTM